MSDWLGKLKALEDSLLRLGRESWPPDQVRDNLKAIGRFCSLSEEVGYAFPRGIVGVDGSLYTYGGSYPYQVTLFRAIARHSQQAQGQDAVVIQDVWSPLFGQEAGASAVSYNDEIDGEEAAAAFRMRHMARLEVRAAIAAIERFRPSALLFDGGFYRLEETGDLWQGYQDAAATEDVHTVGVIEEVGTNALFKLMKVPESMKNLRDRDLLYGVLAPHEVFLPDPSIRLKKKAYYTAFARFSEAPQAVGCDFFAGETRLLQLLSFLDLSTPNASRGIPLWLDIVDADARLTRQEAEDILHAIFSPATIEKWFKPMRARRDY